MTDHNDVRLAMQIAPLLCIFSVLAICSFIVMRRHIFIGGVLGSLSALLIPQPRIYAHYVSGEAAAMAVFKADFSHSLFYGSLGAVVGLLVAVMYFESRLHNEAEA